MKNLIKITLCITLAFAMVVCAGYAAPLDGFSVNDETSDVTIKGAIDGMSENDSITIQVLKINLTENDVDEFYVSGEALIGDFVFFTQIPANEDGGYEETFSMKGENAGFYTVRVNGADAGEIYFTSKESREAIVNQIKKNYADSSASESIEYLKENFELHTESGEGNTESIWLSTFAITDSLVFEVSENGLFKIFVLSIDELTIDNFKELFTDAAYIAAVNEGKIELSEYAEFFGLDEEYVTTYNEKIINENFMDDYFVGKDLTTKEEIAEAFKDAVLTDMVNSFKGWKDVESYIKNFGEVAGVDMKTYDSSKFKSSMKTKLYTYILDKNSFSGIDDFAEAVNDKMEDLLDGKSSGSSGGSGGGSGFSGGSFKSDGSVVTNPVIPVETLPQKTDKENVPAGKFTDLEGYGWAKESIEYLADINIVYGTGEGKYEPSRDVKREEFIVMILRAFNIEPGGEKSDFADAAQDGWYTSYLAAAKAKGFVNGRPDGTFGVGDAITREDVAVMAYNAAKSMGNNFDSSKIEMFTDDEDISAYATEAVYALKNAGVINGKGEGNFEPKATCTRAEAAKIVYLLISK